MCLDCGIDTGKIHEHYFVHTILWLKAAGSIHGMLCVNCMEVRLGRRLQKSDFPNVGINNPKLYPMSNRLIERITGNVSAS
mgnify:CR=1 FL=1